MSVSVADAGETAVVVSVVEGSRRAEEPGGEHSTLDFTTDTKADASLSSNVAFAPQCGDLSSERLGFVPKSESEELKLSLSGDICFSSQFPSIDLTVKADKEETGEQKLVNKLGMSSTKCSSILLEDKMAKSGLDLHLGLSVNSSSTGNWCS